MEATSERIQKKRRKNSDNNAPSISAPKTGKWESFRILKKRKKREEKRKEKEERGTKKAGKRPSDSPRRCAILGGAEGRFWLGQAQLIS